MFVDLAFYRTKWKSFNNNKIGFVIGVEASTQQLAAVAVKSKKKEEWHRALITISDESVIDGVRSMVSDQEPAIVSRSFRREMMQKRGVGFHFLYRKEKSYLAEAMIRWVKTGLSKVSEERRARGEEHRRWVDVLPNLVASFNARKARGTDYSRKDIDRSNYFDFLSKVFKVPDATMLMNSPTLDAEHLFSKKWTNRFFRYNVGERVLVSKRASGFYKADQTFPKPSVHGSYLDKVYKVRRRILKKNRDNTIMVPGKKLSLKTRDP